MPKMKTHSGAKKRFRVTGTGKVMHQRARHVAVVEGQQPQRQHGQAHIGPARPGERRIGAVQRVQGRADGTKQPRRSSCKPR